MKKQFSIFLVLSCFIIFSFVSVNKVHAETEVSGPIRSDTTWSFANSPYIVTASVTVLSGARLTIEPGVVVKFNYNAIVDNQILPYRNRLSIEGGELVAIGTENNKIIFTSNNSSPQAQDWLGIQFYSSINANIDEQNNYLSGSIIKYSIIEYAGINSNGEGSAIYLQNASPYIANNLIRNNKSLVGAGIYMYQSSPTIINNTFSNNMVSGLTSIAGASIYIDQSSPTIIYNTFSNNMVSGGLSPTGAASGIYVKNKYGGYAKINYNTFTGNTDEGGGSSGVISIGEGRADTLDLQAEISYNNISGNASSFGVYSLSDDVLSATYNWWGFLDKDLISLKIYDYDDGVPQGTARTPSGKVNFEPFALAELKFDGTDVFSQLPICNTWMYSEWSSCTASGQQTRSIISSSPSDCTGGSPILTQTCAYAVPACTSWTYSGWGACANGQQTRTITLSQPTNCAGGNPILNQSCNSTPLCTENNWASTLTPTNCPSNGQQTKKWTKIGQCQNGVSHPAEENASCNYQTPTCISFTYSDWGACSLSGAQSRTMLSSSPSNCVGGNPVLTQGCNYIAPPASVCSSWSYSDWGNCVNGLQTRIATSFLPNNCIGGNPVLSQSCQAKTNNIENNNQTKDKNTSDNPVLKIESTSKSVVEEEKQLITKIDDHLSKRISGNILLQVEKNGEGWYIYPNDKKKYYLGRPADAFSIMRNLGLGIKHSELANYVNAKFPSRLSGKILLDVEQNGEAYYINPNDLKGYFLNRPADAFKVMRELGLGITNSDIRKIDVGVIK